MAILHWSISFQKLTDQDILMNLNKHRVQFRKRNDENISEFENFIMIIQKFLEQLEFNF